MIGTRHHSLRLIQTSRFLRLSFYGAGRLARPMFPGALRQGQREISLLIESCSARTEDKVPGPAEIGERLPPNACCSDFTHYDVVNMRLRQDFDCIWKTQKPGQ